ncbi:GTP-binding protein, partial [Candidatus Falkowbacteria bacterium]|nr:GTP-binding protein [Candidatus Falkowbacteria bacterium]
ADVASLVVASNEGVKPQTVEALKIAQESGVPIIVAVNKIDLPDANPDKVKQELSQYNLLSEEWGGKTPFVNISAKMGTNIDEILEQILFVTDVNEETIKANPDGEFFGSIIEAHVDKGEGPVATVLVRNGTLRVGDYVSIDGVLYGKIRMMKNYKGEIVKEAVPSMPAKILGLKIAPKVGDIIEAVDDPKKAKKTKTYRMSQSQDETFIKSKAESNDEDNKIDKLNIILRTDVLGSQEAIIESLKKMETTHFKIKIVSRGLGSVTESDVLNSEATGAVLLGFNVVASSAAASLAQEKEVEIKIYKIIYELIDEVKAQAKKVIKTELVREDLGKIEVLALFSKSDKGQVLGGKVADGKIEAGSLCAVLRKDQFITSGKINKLQVGKEEIKDVVKGQECGLEFEGQALIEVGDVLDIYREREVEKGL